jgi:S1-C subfamily serine protease
MTTTDDGDWLANAAAEPEWVTAIGTPEAVAKGNEPATDHPFFGKRTVSSAPGVGGLPVLTTPPGKQGTLGKLAKQPKRAKQASQRDRSEPRRTRKTTNANVKHDLEQVARISVVAGDGPPVSRRERRAAEKARAARRPKPKMRLLPRSVLGMSMLILAAGIGAAISGTALYMNYAYRRDVSDAQVKGLRTTISKGVAAVEAEGTNARFRIQQELEPLLRQAAIGDTLAQILRDAQPSLWSVRTFDEGGQPTVGTAFVVASDAEKSFLLTSLSVVRAAIVRPGPEIFLQQDKTQATATLWSWQEDNDIALLIVQKGNLPKIQWAKSDSTKVGTQVFAVSGFGTAGGAITNGFIADVSTSGVQHSAALGTAFRGGPLLDGTGKVVAVLSKSYSPFGFASEGVWFAPPVAASCNKVLKCPNGQVTGAGPEQAGVPATVPVPTAAPAVATPSTVA